VSAPPDLEVSAPVTALLRLAREDPDRIAAVAGDVTWTSGRLTAQSARIAAGLVGQGVGVGDRVAPHLYNAPAAALAYLACPRIGAVAVPVRRRRGPRRRSAATGHLSVRPTVHVCRTDRGTARAPT
jgi:acyl-CoA synthetase (AMP-forming)/AMP-acid ligase II